MPSAVSRPVLVIGFGNTLRRDDGVGVRVAELLTVDPRLRRPGVEVRTSYQLLPEMALDFATCSLVVFVDADLRAAPGTVLVRPIDEGAGSPAGSDARSEPGASSHHVEAGELLALAAELTGRRPAGVVVGIGVADTELGEGLSPSVEAVLPLALERVAEIVGNHLSGLEQGRGR